MPGRYLRPGITNSERYNAVSFPAQSLYTRMMVTTLDDYGRCDGRAAIVQGYCFSMWNAMHPDQQVSAADVEAMLVEMKNAGLIDRYIVDDKPYIQFEQWKERIRAETKEKWPAKTCKNLQKPAGNSCRFLPPTSPSPSLPPSSSTPAPTSLPPSSVPSREGLGREGSENSASVVGKEGNGSGGMERIAQLLAAQKRPALSALPDREGVSRYLQSLQNGSEVFSDSFYDAMVKQGWRDKAGKPIADWRKVAKQYAGTSLMKQRQP